MSGYWKVKNKYSHENIQNGFKNNIENPTIHVLEYPK